MFREEAEGRERERGQEHHIGQERHWPGLYGAPDVFGDAIATNVAAVFVPRHHAMTIYASAHTHI